MNDMKDTPPHIVKTHNAKTHNVKTHNQCHD